MINSIRGLENLKWLLLLLPALARAQNNKDAPPLRPPLTEIPPTAWEQYGIWIWLGMALGIAVLGALIWWLLQPKPVAPEPIEARTRRELEALRGKPLDGRALSQLSQSVRRYFAEAFEMSRDELTTTDFAAAAVQSGKLGAELARTATDFLRRLDAIKFSSASASGFNDALAEAWQLYERGEARRAELRAKAIRS